MKVSGLLSWNVLVLVSSAFPISVYGKHLLTIAVAFPGEANRTSIVGSRQFTVGNETSPDVTVLWTSINQRHPFQIIKHLEELARRKVDLLILPENITAVIKETSGGKTLPLVLYSTVSQTDSSQSSCGTSIDSQSRNLPEPEMTCDGPGLMVSKTEALVAVILKLEWTELVILHEEREEMVATDLSDKLAAAANPTMIRLYSLTGLVPDGVTSGADQGSALHGLMEELYDKREEELRVVVLCSGPCVQQVLTAASKFDALNDKKTAMVMISRWLLVLPPQDQQMLETCGLELDNVAVVVHPPPSQRPLIKDIEKEMGTILQSAYSNLVMANITVSANNLSQAIRQDVEVPYACYRSHVSTLLWKPEGRRLSDVGHVSYDGQLHTEEEQEVFPNIKFGLNNRKFIVATLMWPSFVERTENGSYEGLCVDLLHQLQSTLNFSYVWVEPEDQQWGTLTENHTWTGLVGLLEKQEVDMVAAPISVQAEREEVMDFMHAFFTDYTTVLLKLPDPADSKWKTLIQPFKTQVHMYIWISLLGVTVLTYSMEFVNPYYATNTKSMLYIGDMFWYMFGALLTQGGARLPDSQTGRTMVSAFWLFSIVMAAIYSGNLIAFLTVSKDKPPFETIKGMVQQDVYTWGLPGGTFWETLFQISSNEVFRKIWEGIERERDSDPDVLASDTETHLAKVKAGHYAYIGDKSAISTWLKSECDLITIKEEFLPMQYAFGLINNSAYTRMFSDEMLQINEIGLIQTWKGKWWNKVSFCKGALIAEATPIGLIDVQSAFYLVFIGITVALLVLTSEKLFSRFQVIPKLKQKLRKKKEAAAGESSAWSSTVTCPDGVKVRVRREAMTNGRPLGSEFRHAGLFDLQTSDLREKAYHNRNGSGDREIDRNTYYTYRREASDTAIDRKTYYTYRREAVNHHDHHSRDAVSGNAQDKPEQETSWVASSPTYERGGHKHLNGKTTSHEALSNGILKNGKNSARNNRSAEFYLN